MLPTPQANEPRGAEGIAETKQAYEFTLDTIGQDIHSGGAKRSSAFSQAGSAWLDLDCFVSVLGLDELNSL